MVKVFRVLLISTLLAVLLFLLAGCDFFEMALRTEDAIFGSQVLGPVLELPPIPRELVDETIQNAEIVYMTSRGDDNPPIFNEADRRNSNDGFIIRINGVELSANVTDNVLMASDGSDISVAFILVGIVFSNKNYIFAFQDADGNVNEIVAWIYATEATSISETTKIEGQARAPEGRVDLARGWNRLTYKSQGDGFVVRPFDSGDFSRFRWINP
jgi:hypothetical protein